jgi:hypothetical protein
MTKADDFLAKTSLENNLLDRITAIERALALLKQRDVYSVNLAEITDDAGDLRSGRFLALSSGFNPDDVDANGCFMSAEGEEFGGELYNIGGVENGALQFGMRNSDGAGVFAGGDAVIGSEGINIDQMGYLIQHTATDGTTERTGSLGMWATPGSTEPCYGIAYNAPADESELFVNGGFETDAAGTTFTAWTKTTETNCAWEVYNSYSYEGDNCALLFGAQANNIKTGVLTSDRMAVSASTNYQLACAIWASSLDYAKVEVKWYDDPTAGSLISTDTPFYQTGGKASYTHYSSVIKSPATAESCTVVITASRAASAASYIEMLFDSFSLQAISVSSQLYFDSTGKLNLTGLPVFADSYSGFWTQFRGYLANGTEVAAITDTLANTDTRSGVYKLWNNTAFPTSGTYIECQVPLAQGTYTMNLCRVRGTSFGKVDLYIDGVKQTSTPIDFYGATAYTIDTTITGVVVSGDGVHTVRFQMDSKNASASGYGIGGSLFSFCKTS